MRLRVSASVLALAVLSSLAFASGALAGTRVTMKPGAGKPTTRFVASFRAPARTGVVGTVSSHYQLSAAGPKGKRCVSSISIHLASTKLHAHVKVTLRPRGHGGVWCSGKFHGKILEFQSILCRPVNACPDIVILPQTIARFSFTVKKAKTGGGQSAGPTFAGLESVTTCTPLTPQLVPQRKTYMLTWHAASDPGTSSAQMVYKVFYSSPRVERTTRSRNGPRRLGRPASRRRCPDSARSTSSCAHETRPVAKTTTPCSTPPSTSAE